MKSLQIYISAILLGLVSQLAIGQTEFNRYATDPTSDLALIYAGADRRPQWTVDEVMPYVVHTYADGTKDWFFDSFLLLEFTSGSTDKGFQNGVGSSYADKSDWEWLLDKHMECLASLDKAITLGKAELGEPRMRHTVVLGMPAPIKAQGKNFGKVNGKKLDFSKDSDRVAANKWYIDRAIKRFTKAGFENLDLIGFYWVEEGLYTNGEVVPLVNDYIKSKSMRSYWIPYYANNEQFKWNWNDKYRFDIAYQQPNYFFERHIPLSRLDAACDESKKYGLGLEMEFETQGTSRVQHDDPDSYYDRLVDYIEAFERNGVYSNSAVAWYSGTKGFLDLARSSDAKNHEIADRMARIVAERQKHKNHVSK